MRRIRSALLLIMDDQEGLGIVSVIEEPEFHRVRPLHLTGCDAGIVIDDEDLAVRCNDT
mgnify:CR=1 FL=1